MALGAPVADATDKIEMRHFEDATEKAHMSTSRWNGDEVKQE